MRDWLDASYLSTDAYLRPYKTSTMEIFCKIVNGNYPLQKQPSKGILSERCSENMQQIYRGTPMPKRDFSCKFAAYLQNTFL